MKLRINTKKYNLSTVYLNCILGNIVCYHLVPTLCNINTLFQEKTEDIIDAEEEPVETLVISDDLAKTHFPELLEQKTEVFEVTDKEGEVVEQFRAVEQNPEELLTNVEALEKMEIEANNEGLFKVHTVRTPL